jgi:hypothetical protein
MAKHLAPVKRRGAPLNDEFSARRGLKRSGIPRRPLE